MSQQQLREVICRDPAIRRKSISLMRVSTEETHGLAHERSRTHRAHIARTPEEQLQAERIIDAFYCNITGWERSSVRDDPYAKRATYLLVDDLRVGIPVAAMRIIDGATSDLPSLNHLPLEMRPIDTRSLAEASRLSFIVHSENVPLHPLYGISEEQLSTAWDLIDHKVVNEMYSFALDQCIWRHKQYLLMLTRCALAKGMRHGGFPITFIGNPVEYRPGDLFQLSQMDICKLIGLRSQILL